MLGWSRKFCILIYRMNWVRKFYCKTLFFYTTLIATMNPVFFSMAKKTFPNLPSPSFCIISKLSILSYIFWVNELFYLFLGDNPYWIFLLFCNPFFRNEGIDFSERAPTKILSVEFVELVYLRFFVPFASKAELLKKGKFFSPVIILLFLLTSLGLGFIVSLSKLLLFLGNKLKFFKMNYCWLFGEAFLSSAENFGRVCDCRSSCEEYLENWLDFVEFY